MKFEKSNYCGPIIIALLIISIVLSISTVIFLLHANKYGADCVFSFGDTSLTVLSILVTVLIGWSIWSTVDCKGLSDKMNKEANYIHNKIDYQLGLFYGNFSQMLAVGIANVNEQDVKFAMINYMINCLKILSKLPGTTDECNSIASSVTEAIQASKKIAIKEEDAKFLLKKIGEIENKNAIKGLDKIIDELIFYLKREV